MVRESDVRGFVEELRRLYGISGELDVRELKKISDDINVNAVIARRGPPERGGNVFMLYIGNSEAYDSHSGRRVRLSGKDRVMLFGRFMKEAMKNFRGSDDHKEDYRAIRDIGYPVEMSVDEFNRSVPDYSVKNPLEEIGRIVQGNAVDCGLYSLVLADYLDPSRPKL